jgi:hypothetical protein
MVSINKGLREDNSFWYWLGYISLGIGASILTLFFFIYSILLLRYITSPDQVLENNSESQNLPLEKSPPRGSIETRVKVIENHDWQDILSIDSGMCSNNSMETSKYVDVFRKTEIAEDKYFVSLSTDDRRIIKKLLMMMSVSGVSGLLIIAVGTPYTLSKSLNNNPGVTLFGLFCAFILEVAICVSVLVAFSTQIKSANKANIKQLTYMARLFRNQAPNLHLPPRFKRISRRLLSYYT